MKKVTMFLLLLAYYLSALAEQATASWDAAPAADFYNLYKNGALSQTNITGTSTEVDKQDGDTFYVTTVLAGIESTKSDVVVIPYAPVNFRLTIVIEGK